MTRKRILLGALLLTAAGAFRPVQAQTAGTCQGGTAAVDLDINNVRARIYNNGGLFWKGAGSVYNVPKAQPGLPIVPNPIFASGIWIAGFVGSEIRMAATAYGDWEFYPGPLNADGTLPNASNCNAYDRVYLIDSEDIKDYRASGATTNDLTDWPTGLGAPTYTDVNGDGRYKKEDDQLVTPTSRDQKINLAANQLPLISGDQMAWWVMNDVGGAHRSTGSKPIGLEVQASAFAFRLAGDIGNTTFYRYKLIYKGTQPLTNSYMAVWSDPDLGDASDDYVGSDSTLGLGYVYNADNFDGGGDGFGAAPPALGYDFFQGPLVDDPTGPGHYDPDSTFYPGKKRLGATRFLYYNNDNTNHGNPRNSNEDWYYYMAGQWRDRTFVRACSNGDATTFTDAVRADCGANAERRANWMYPGDPVTNQFWSEFKPTPGATTSNAPSDRRFLLATGPFTIQPGDQQTIVFGIVFARGTSNLNSVTRLRSADALAQQAFNADFQLAVPPDPPRVTVSELDREVVLSWSYLPQDNNYFESYEEFNPLARPDGDRTYNFEGYNIYRYPTSEFSDDDRELVATYDVVNGVGRVLESDPDGLTFVAANGTDSGIQNSIRLTGLTNYRQYYYGVEAYAYNGGTDVNIAYPSATTKVIVMPSPAGASNGGTVVDPSNYGQSLTATKGATNGGEGVASATIIDPARVTGDTYQVKFYNVTVGSGADAHSVTTYDIVNTRTNAKLFDGTVYVNNTGEAPPQRENVVQGEGLSFTVSGPQPGYSNFLTTRNAAGPLNTTPPQYGAMDPNHRGFPRGGADPFDQTAGVQQSTNNSRWGLQTANTGTSDPPAGFADSFDYFKSRTLRDGLNLPSLGANDYEFRFTAGGGISLNWFVASNDVVPVPFEVWDVGTKPDASDDVRLIALLNPIAGGNLATFGLGNDHPTSGGTDDPQTDWIYVFRPENQTPGDAGYQAYAAEVARLGTDWDGEGVRHNDAHPTGLDEVMARLVFVSWNGGAAPAGPFNAPVPETGTVFKVITFKPNLPNDVFTLNTATVAAETGNDSVRTAAIDQIAIVPNPYRGASAYEVSNLADVARFINLPERATIRVFTLSGTLIKTLVKSGPGRSVDWDLQTDAGLPIASGMYLIHVQVQDANGADAGEKILKFGVVKKRIQLDVL